MQVSTDTEVKERGVTHANQYSFNCTSIFITLKLWLVKANIVTVRYTEFSKASHSTVYCFYLKIRIQDQSGILTGLEIGK